MSLIEKTFAKKTEGNEAYRVLVNYWNCTRIQVPKILSCISQIFPHYTMHDVSHSNAILDSIERFLGPETIDSLSVTDLWLLLCSAYCHDIGMYITGDEIKKCFDSDEFQKFVLDIKNDTKSPLNKYAVYFILEDGKLKYKKCELSLNSYHSARFLLAEYFRKKHAERSETFIQTDNSVVQMFSEIKRLTLIVAEICRLHGAEFKKVMEFYNYENGIEDYCHPRFVACMLRIGDLLDFDSSRVSRFLLEHLSFSIPEDSKIHNEKNFCINHALVTPEKVDVLAECSDVNTAFEIDKWFSWIRDEMSNQRNLWHDIAPTPSAKGYPMLGKLETRLLGDYDTIDNNYKPKFEIDSEKATEILQGAGLYGDRIQCIREILQNAIDATYLRIYLDNSDFASLSLEDGYKKFVEYCGLDKYQIEVNCERKNNIWHIEIQDNGIGIRKEDLKYLLKIGSGKNNKKKFEIIEKMPEYAKPSGIFGIGFQSIFLITDKVYIETRSTLDNKLIKVEIGTPLKDGFAIIKTQEDPFAKIGTKISFDVSENKIAGKFTSVKKYDFIEDDINDVRLARITGEVNLVGKNSYIKIKYNKEYIKKEDNGMGQIYQDDKNDKSSKMIMEIMPLFEKSGRRRRFDHDIYYRNEIIRFVDFSSKIAFVPWKVNILSESSDDILLVSRNGFKKEKEKIIIKTIIKLGIRWINENWNRIDEKFKPTCAAFVEYYGEEEQKEKIKAYRDKLLIWGNSIEDILKYKSVVFKDFRMESVVEKKENQLIINDFFNMGNDVSDIEYLSYILRRYYNYGVCFKYEKFKDNVGDYEEFIVLEYEKNTDDRVDWKGWLRCYVFEYYRREPFLRSLMPCIGYEKLKIKNNIKNNLVRKEPMEVFERLEYSRTVCPYVFEGNKIEWNCSDKLYQWVYENRFDNNVTIDEIKEVFKTMKTDFSGYIKELNDEIEEKKRVDGLKNL